MLKTILAFISATFVLVTAVPLYHQHHYNNKYNKASVRYGVHALTGNPHPAAVPHIIRIARMQRRKARRS